MFLIEKVCMLLIVSTFSYISEVRTILPTNYLEFVIIQATVERFAFSFTAKFCVKLSAKHYTECFLKLKHNLFHLSCSISISEQHSRNKLRMQHLSF